MYQERPITSTNRFRPFLTSIGARENVALAKPAWMSTIREQAQHASNAVDGVISATHERYSAHTKAHERTAWWKVDLQIDVQSALIKIYFRRDCKYDKSMS